MLRKRLFCSGLFEPVFEVWLESQPELRRVVQQYLDEQADGPENPLRAAQHARPPNAVRVRENRLVRRGDMLPRNGGKKSGNAPRIGGECPGGKGRFSLE